MDDQLSKNLDRCSDRQWKDKRDSTDDQSFFRDPDDDIDPATRDRDERPRIQVFGYGIFGFVFAALAAGAVLGAQAGLRSPWWFVGLLLLFTPIFSYLMYWLHFVHPAQINEKLKAERAARGGNSPGDGGTGGNYDD